MIKILFISVLKLKYMELKHKVSFCLPYFHFTIEIYSSFTHEKEIQIQDEFFQVCHTMKKVIQKIKDKLFFVNEI